MSDTFQPIPEGGETLPTEMPDAPASYGGRAPEATSFNPAAPRAPNSFYLPLWPHRKGGHGAFLSWQSDNPIAVLALVVIVLLLLTIFGLGGLEGFTHQRFTWLADVQKVLGQALLTVIGAIVGAAASPSKKAD